MNCVSFGKHHIRDIQIGISVVDIQRDRAVLHIVKNKAVFRPTKGRGRIEGICLCNDLTKLYERIYRGKPAQVLEELNSNPDSEKGEYTLVVEFPNALPKQETIKSGETTEGKLINYMVLNNSSAKEAISALSGNGISKKELYAAALHLKELFSSD